MAHSLSDISQPSVHLARKRGRCNSFQNTGPPEKYQAMHQTYLRDDTYYFEDGSCILLVENVLFNVRFLSLCDFKTNSSSRSIDQS